MKNCFLIVNYNDYDTTKVLLDNISSYKILDKIVVVDNCSTDDSYKKLKKIESDKIIIVRAKKNLGCGAGNNLGIKKIISKYKSCNVFVSNADVVIEKESDLKKLIDVMDDDTAIVAPIIREKEGYNRGWKIPSPFLDSLMNFPIIHKYIRKKFCFYPNSYFKDEIVEVESVSGSFFLTRTDVIKDVGFYDENVFLYYEENIISKKIQNINKKIKINTEVEVFHNHSVTIDKSINYLRKFKLLKESQYYFQTKYNDAGVFSKICLIFSRNVTYFLLKIRSLLKN